MKLQKKHPQQGELEKLEATIAIEDQNNLIYVKTNYVEERQE